MADRKLLRWTRSSIQVSTRLSHGLQPARPCVTLQVASKLNVHTISLDGALFLSYPTPGV